MTEIFQEEISKLKKDKGDTTHMYLYHPISLLKQKSKYYNILDYIAWKKHSQTYHITSKENKEHKKYQTYQRAESEHKQA